MNTRERNLALALGGVAALFVGRWLIMDVILGPLRAKQAQVASLEDRLEDKKIQLNVQMQAADQLKKWKAASLTSDDNTGSSVLYRGYLTTLLTKAGIKNPNITTGPVRKVRDDFRVMTFQVNAECDLAQLSKLLFEFQRTDVLQEIKTIDVRPQVTNDKIEHLVAKLDVEVLAFPDAPYRDTLEPGNKPDDKKLADFKYLADKNFFQPTTIIDRTAVVRTDRDDRATSKFNGTVRANGVFQFLFYNGSTSKMESYAVGDTLPVVGMKAKIVGYDKSTDEVLLEWNGKVGGVRTGQALTTWKETANRSAVLNLAAQPTP